MTCAKSPAPCRGLRGVVGTGIFSGSAVNWRNFGGKNQGQVFHTNVVYRDKKRCLLNERPDFSFFDPSFHLVQVLAVLIKTQ